MKISKRINLILILLFFFIFHSNGLNGIGVISRNNQIIDINNAQNYLKKLTNSNLNDSQKITLLLKVKTLIKKIKNRNLQSKQLSSLLREYKEIYDDTIRRFEKKYNDNLSENSFKVSIKYVRFLIKLSPDNPQYKKIYKTLTKKNRRRAFIKSYTLKDVVNLRKHEKKKTKDMLKEALVLLRFRYLKKAEEEYKNILEMESRNIEAEKNLKIVHIFQKIEKITNDIRKEYESPINSLKREKKFLFQIEKIDYSCRLRKKYYFPKPSIKILKDSNIKQKFDARCDFLEKEYSKDLFYCGKISLLIKKVEIAEKYLKFLEEMDSFSMDSLDLRLNINIFKKKYFKVLSEISSIMKTKNLSSNIIFFYMKLPVVWLGELLFGNYNPNFWFVANIHSKVYVRVYWPLILLFIFQLSYGTWSGIKTYNLWDLVTDGMVTKTLTFNNKSPIYFFDKATQAFETGKNEKAIKFYTKAIEADEMFSNAYLNRARVHWIEGNYQNAKKDYEKCVKLRPNDNRTKYHLAIAYDRLNMKKEALEIIEEAIGMGFQNRGYKMDEVIKNHHQYSKVFKELKHTAEKLLKI